MRHPRITSSLVLVLGLLALLVTPLTASAGSGPQKKAAAASKAASKKKVDPARSAAAKKGWETRRINQKAEANWASRVSKNPAADTPAAKAAFLKRSVASQRSWQKRKAAASASSAKTAGKKAKNGKASKNKKKVAAASSSKNKKKSSKKATTKKAKKVAAAADDSPAGSIASSGAGAAEFKNALARFEEAQFAQSEGRADDAAVAQMEGHDLMAQAAFAAADAYEAAGNDAEADKLNTFGEAHLAEGDKIEAAIQASDAADQSVAGGPAEADRPSRPSGFRRFLARLNPANWGSGNRTASSDNRQFGFE